MAWCMRGTMRYRGPDTKANSKVRCGSFSVASAAQVLRFPRLSEVTTRQDEVTDLPELRISHHLTTAAFKDVEKC